MAKAAVQKMYVTFNISMIYGLYFPQSDKRMSKINFVDSAKVC